MGAVIGNVLPLAVGIAISPLPIVAVVLMLLAPEARATSLSYLAGWLAGIVAVLVIFTLLSSVLPQQDPSQAQPIAGVVKILLGVLLLLLAVRQFRTRPRGDEPAELPKWMSAIDTLSAARGLAIGVLLAALNPKNLIMGIAAGTTVGSAQLSLAQNVIVVVVFTLLAGSTVLVPVLAYLVAADAMATPLRQLRGWLVRNNHAVMSVLFLVLGVVLIGKGIGSF